MGCYFMVSTYIDDQGARSMYDEYIEKVKPIVKGYGGEYLVRGEELAASSDKWRPDADDRRPLPDRKSLEACFRSPEYIAIANLRLLSVEARTIIAEGL